MDSSERLLLVNVTHAYVDYEGNVDDGIRFTSNFAQVGDLEPRLRDFVRHVLSQHTLRKDNV